MKNKWDIFLPNILAMPLLFGALFCCFLQTTAQECPSLINPINNSEQVSVNTTIQWEPVTGVPGYILSLGTTPGGNDIVNEQNVGSSTSFNPPFGLPENTEIFVTITLFFFNQPNIICDTQRFTTASLTEVPECTSLQNPADGTIDVNPSTNLTWSAAPSATGYYLTMGTTANGGEIINNVDVKNTLNYSHINDLPAETEIFVTIIPYNRIGNAVSCSTFTFITAAQATLPTCSNLITPLDGETNVALSPVLEWSAVPNATGYRVSIGTSPFETDIIDNATFFKTSTVVIDFEPNRTFFMTITPFNAAGDAIGCSQSTFSTLLGCGPYFNPQTGALEVLNPVLTFPEKISICLDDNSNLVSSTDKADGYRWYQIEESGSEKLISTLADVSFTEAGDYRLEAYNIIENENQTFECETTKFFKVTVSAKPVIEEIKVTQQGNTLNYEIQTTEEGNFEYALDNENGPFQASNRFKNIPLTNHTVYVRDKDGCGLAQRTVQQDLTVNGFPNFFTPNGDGVNDYWQFIPTNITEDNIIKQISIFDKFGTLLVTLSPNSIGWDGRFNGNKVPESNYWYKAISNNNNVIKGHFSLKR